MDKDLIAHLRGFEADHAPEGWPGIRMREVSALLDALEEAERRESELYGEMKMWEQQAGVIAEECHELKRKLAIAREALEKIESETAATWVCDTCKEVLAQIGDSNA